MLFKGSGVALVTPFHEDGSVHYEKLEELIEFHITHQTDSIIVCGTTGESATLSNDEKKEVIAFVVNTVHHRIPVIAGTGSNNTKIAVEMSQYAEEVGCDGLLIVTPYYNKCTQEGLLLHYKEIANAVSLPIIAYNVPSRTGVDIAVDTLVSLSHIPNICGIKEASGDISKVASILQALPENFMVYSGNDDQALPMLALGGAGVISVTANIFPKEIHMLCQSFFEGDILAARKLHERYLEVSHALFLEVNPIPVKEAMNIMGFAVGPCRLPLSMMNPQKAKTLEQALVRVQI